MTCAGPACSRRTRTLWAIAPRSTTASRSRRGAGSASTGSPMSCACSPHCRRCPRTGRRAPEQGAERAGVAVTGPPGPDSATAAALTSSRPVDSPGTTAGATAAPRRRARCRRRCSACRPPARPYPGHRSSIPARRSARARTAQRRRETLRVRLATADVLLGDDDGGDHLPDRAGRQDRADVVALRAGDDRHRHAVVGSTPTRATVSAAIIGLSCATVRDSGACATPAADRPARRPQPSPAPSRRSRGRCGRAGAGRSRPASSPSQMFGEGSAKIPEQDGLVVGEGAVEIEDDGRVVGRGPFARSRRGRHAEPDTAARVNNLVFANMPFLSDSELDALLEQLPALAGRPPPARGLSGGLTNRNVKITTPTGAYFIRDAASTPRTCRHRPRQRVLQQQGGRRDRVGAPVIDYAPIWGSCWSVSSRVSPDQRRPATPGVLAGGDRGARPAPGPASAIGSTCSSVSPRYLKVVQDNGFRLPALPRLRAAFAEIRRVLGQPTGPRCRATTTYWRATSSTTASGCG